MQPQHQTEGDLTPNLPNLSAPPPASPAGRETRLRRSTRSPKSPMTASPASSRRSKGAPASGQKNSAKNTPSPGKSRKGQAGIRGANGDDDVCLVVNGNSVPVQTQGGDGKSIVEKPEDIKKSGAAARVVSLPADGIIEEVLEESGPKPNSGQGLVTEEVLAESGVGDIITEELIEESAPKQGAGDEEFTEEVLDGSKPNGQPDENNVTEEVLDEGKAKSRSGKQHGSRQTAVESTVKKRSPEDNVTEEVLTEGKPDSAGEHVTEEVLEEGEPKRRSGSGRRKSATSPEKAKRRSGKAPWGTPTSNKPGKPSSASIAREQNRSFPKKELPSIGLHAMKFVADLNAPSDVDQDSPEISRQRKGRDKMDDGSSSESDASSSPRHSAPISHSRPYPRRKGGGADSDQSGSDLESDGEHSGESDSEFSGASSGPRAPSRIKPRKRAPANDKVRRSLGKRPRVLIKQKHVPLQKSAATRVKGPSSDLVATMRSATAAAIMGREDATIQEAMQWLEGMIRARRRPGRPSKSALKERERLGRQRDQLRRELRAIEEQRGERRPTRKLEDDKAPQKSVEKEDSGSSGSSYESGKDSNTPEPSPNKTASELEPDVTLVKRVEKSPNKPADKDAAIDKSQVGTEKDDDDVVMVEVPKAMSEKRDPAIKKQGSSSFSRFKGRKSPSPNIQPDDLEAGPDTKMDLQIDSGEGDALSPEDYSVPSDEDETVEAAGEVGQGSEAQKKGKDYNGDSGITSRTRRTWAVKHPRRPAVRRTLANPTGVKNAEPLDAGVGKALPENGPDRKRRERTASFASLGKREPNKKRRADGCGGSEASRDARQEIKGCLGEKTKTVQHESEAADGAASVKDVEVVAVNGTQDDTLVAHKAIEEKDQRIVRLREEMSEMHNKLDKGSKRAVELQTAMYIAAGTDGSGAAKATESSANVTELVAKLAERERELGEREDQLREKSAAMKEFLSQIKRLEVELSAARVGSAWAARTGSGSEQLEETLLRVAELEAVASERSGELESVRAGMRTDKRASEAKLRTHATQIAKLEAGLAEKERQVVRLQELLRDRDRVAEEQLNANLACIAELEVALGEKTKMLERAGAGGEGDGENGEEDRIGFMRVAELETAVEEKDERIERLHQQVQNHASVLKGAVKANRNLQQKLYAVNRVR